MPDLIHQHIVRKINQKHQRKLFAKRPLPFHRRYNWYLVWRSPVAKLILFSLFLGVLIATGDWAIVRLWR